jgi:hypothetical protein
MKEKLLGGVRLMSTLVCCKLSPAKQFVARDAGSRRYLQSGSAQTLSLVRIDVNRECYYSGVWCFFVSSSLVSPISYGHSVPRQQLLATSLRLDNRAPLGARNSFVPGLLLAKSGSGGLNDTARSASDVDAPLSACAGVLDRGAQAAVQTISCSDATLPQQE